MTVLLKLVKKLQYCEKNVRTYKVTMLQEKPIYKYSLLAL